MTTVSLDTKELKISNYELSSNKKSLKLDLRVSNDRMFVLLNGFIDEEDLGKAIIKIYQNLLSMGISKPPSHEELLNTLRMGINKGSEVTDLPIMEGVPAIHTKHGKVDWCGNFLRPTFVLDRNSSEIDLREKNYQPHVNEKQLIANLVQPVEGVEGHNVFNEIIKIEKPNGVQLNVGTNVFKGDNKSYYAMIDGRVRWSYDTLMVDPLFIINGKLDTTETGSISYNGALHVKGNISSGSKVKADGDIEIDGTLESTDIEAGGNLIVHGGITGSENHFIKVQGYVKAKFILGASIEANDDVIAQREIMNSKIKTKGAIIIPEGRIVGGCIIALGGIVTGYSGSEGESPTVLITGLDYSLENDLTKKKNELMQIERNLEKIHTTVDPLMKREKLLTHKQREAATELLSRAMEMDMIYEEISKEIKDIERNSNERARYYLFILKKLFPKTQIKILNFDYKVTELMNGPLFASSEKENIKVEKCSNKFITEIGN
jgi:uncharacterized protein